VNAFIQITSENFECVGWFHTDRGTGVGVGKESDSLTAIKAIYFFTFLKEKKRKA
jgi:hypothetical protein